MKSLLYKVKSGKIEAWRAWTTELTTRTKEAEDTMRYEGVTKEYCLLFELDEQFYVLGFVEGEARLADVSNPLNQRHAAMKKECLEKATHPEILYFFTTQ